MLRGPTRWGGLLSIAAIDHHGAGSFRAARHLDVAKSNPGWFPKGRSGNLNGRPRASRVSRGSGFEVLVEKTLSVADDRAGTREITLQEALQQRTYHDALASMSTRGLKPNTFRYFDF